MAIWLTQRYRNIGQWISCMHMQQGVKRLVKVSRFLFKFHVFQYSLRFVMAFIYPELGTKYHQCVGYM